MNHLNLKTLSLHELRTQWRKSWGQKPHNRIGRKMMEKSLAFKINEPRLSPTQQSHLNKLIVEYKRNPKYFDSQNGVLKPGTRLTRTYQGKRHAVLVTEGGFEYNGQPYSSLSKIANDITGKRWNGWVFFGLKKAGIS